MKLKHLIILSIIPILIFGVGLFTVQKMKSLPQAEKATELRYYIGNLETQQAELNEREKEMLIALKASLQELDNYYAIYPNLRSAIVKGNSGLWKLGLIQLALTITIYIKTRPNQSQ